jgi:hypothetical protein
MLMLAGCSSEASSQADAMKVANDSRTAAGGSATGPTLSAPRLSDLMAAKVEDAITICAGCTCNYTGTDEFAGTMETGAASACGPGGAKPDEYSDLPGVAAEPPHLHRRMNPLPFSTCKRQATLPLA